MTTHTSIRKPRLTHHERDARDLAILQMWDEGYILSEIAAKMRMPQSTVHRKLRDCDAPRRNYPIERYFDSVKQYLREGKSCPEIAKLIGCDLSQVYYVKSKIKAQVKEAAGAQ